MMYIKECKIMRKKVEELEKVNARLTKDLQNLENKQKSTPIIASKVSSLFYLCKFKSICQLLSNTIQMHRTWKKSHCCAVN